ncbi:MAG: bifunctional oligoribonuclease/PAP phosphatase NrnA [Bacteroidales bacterium]|nr:bifunctional oligoribonuclease/PAP phosphatase NrnA [Bacteroidales bacterium]
MERMIPCITRSKIEFFKTLLDGASEVTVAAHVHPDGDALGSTAAMCSYLRNVMGKDAVGVLPEVPPESIRFIIPENVPFIFADQAPDAAEGRIAKSDLVILMDCNGFSRTENLRASLEASKAPKVLIDHHLNPQEQEFSLVFSTPEISSASELLYWILKDLGGKLPADCMNALLAGMTTDTNNFANSVFPSTFRMASDLIAAGTDRDAVIGHIYQEYRENRIRLMGYMQSREMNLTPEGAAWMVLTKDIQERFGYREGEAEGLVNIPLAIKEVRLSVLLTEKDGCMRVSVRSKKGTSAQQLAVRYFNGGGHENAAGGKLAFGEDIPDAKAAPAYVEHALKQFLA